MSDDILKIDPTQPGADRQMMLTPDYWPHNSFLPLIGGPGDGIGVLVLVAGCDRWTVYHVNIVDSRLSRLLAGDQDTGVQASAYCSVDELLEAGWRVD